MPSIEPFGEKIRSLRKSLGLTQLELAVQAGVSERTVRNAERGRPLKRDFLLYLATALGVDIRDVVSEAAQIAPFLRWRRNTDAINEIVTLFLQTGDATGFFDMAHRDIEIVCRIDLALPGATWMSSSDFSGMDGARRYIDKVLQLNSQTVTQLAQLQRPRGDGNIVVMRGTEFRRFTTGDEENAWSVRVFDFAEGRIRRYDEYFGALQVDWPASEMNEHSSLSATDVASRPPSCRHRPQLSTY